MTALVLAVSGWLGVRALLAKAALDEARPAAERVMAAVTERGAGALTETSVRQDIRLLAERSETLASLTSDPVWRVAERLPEVGPTMSASRIGAAEASRLLGDAVVPVLDTTDELADGLRVSDGRIDVGALEDLHTALATADETARTALERLGRVPRGGVDSRVGEHLNRMQALLTHTTPALDTLADVTEAAPAVLGAEGPRLILIMLQNNAELRSGGGITGTFFAVEIDNGRFTGVDHTDSAAFSPADVSPVPIPAGTRETFGDEVGRYVQNLTTTPDFALSGRLASAWWAEHTGRTPDMVVAIDPAVVRTLLEVTGPLRAGEADLTAGNVVEALLRRPYLTMDADEQTEYFFGVSEALAQRLVSSANTLPQVAGAAAPLIEEGRVAVWSRHPQEQALIADTPLAGLLGRLETAGDDAYAVLFNNLSGSKLDAYLDAGFSAVVDRCRPDGRGSVAVSTGLVSEVPTDVDLPWYAAPGFGGYAREDLALLVTVLAPPGTVPEGAWLDGAPLSSHVSHDAGRSAVTARVALPPGHSAHVTFRFVAAEPGPVEPALLHTPLIDTADVVTTGQACEVPR